MTTTSLVAPNSILFVLDRHHKNILVPQYDGRAVVSASPSCISVATVADGDEVTVHLDRRGEVTRPELQTVFDGALETPGKKLAVVTSLNEVVLETEVPTAETRVLVRVDDSDSPCVIQVLAR